MKNENILVGTSGFSFPDWVGTVYPPDIKREEILTYYYQNLGMEAVVIISTYYALIRQKTIENMVKRVSPQFKFAVKAYQGITHQFGKKSQAEIQKDIENFRFTIEPLAKGDRLIAVLLQFSYTFRPSQESLDYLSFLRDGFTET